MIDARIQQFLFDNPGGSIRQIASGTGIRASTVWHLLTTRLGYVWCKCRLVPHTLSKAASMERLERSQVILITLHPAKYTAWRFFSTRNESWFFYYIPHREHSKASDVESPEVARQLIVTPKLMITIFWSVSGIHMIDYLPPCTSFDSTCFVDHILCGFNTLPIMSVEVRQKSICDSHGQFANAHIKSIITKISSMSMQLAPHPPYSPDLAPPDFCRFGHLKCQMIGREFDSPEDLVRWIRAAFLRISRDTIERVVDEWIDRVDMKVPIFPRSKKWPI
jgi:histone-lysine N-methyltransferase SETMAR